VFTSEFKLAVACCRWSISGVDADEIRQLSCNIEWLTFLRIIQRHRIQGIVAQTLSKNGISTPAPIAQAIRTDTVAICARNLRSAAETLRLLREFDDASMPILFVKGLTLSAIAYGDPFVKMSSDVDFLVEPNAIGGAADILASLGYRLIVPAVDPLSSALPKWHSRLKESVWENPSTGLVVELHTRLADNPALIPTIGMGSPRQWIQVGSIGAFPTLTTDDLFAYLCVHGASSAWFRLKWIADLAGLVHKCGVNETERLYRASQLKAAGRAPAQALLLADRLSLLPVPTLLREQLMRDKANRLLTAVALWELGQAREPTERPLGTAGIHLTQPFLLKGWQFKVSDLKRQVRDMIGGFDGA